jgi:hypothetical protein
MATNRYRQLLASIPKGDFYASDGQVLPNRDTPYQIRITTSAPNRQFGIFLNDNFLGAVVSNAQSVAILNIQLVKGTNVIKLVDSQTQQATLATVTTRDYATMLAASAEVLENLDTQIEQAYADSRLSTVSAGMIEPAFGRTVNTANDMSYSLDVYRELIQELRGAYRHYGATVEGISRAVRAFTLVSPLIYPAKFASAWLLGENMLSAGYDISGGTFYTVDPTLTGASIQGSGAGVSITSIDRKVGVGTGSIKWTPGSPGTLQWQSPVGAIVGGFGPAVQVTANGDYTLEDTQYTPPMVGQPGPYKIVAGQNDKITLEFDDKGQITVTLTAGTSRTATQVASDINTAFNTAYGSSYNAVASSVGTNACLRLATPNSGTGSVKVWPTNGTADAAQTLFNLPFVRGGLSGTHSSGVFTLQLSSDTDMTPWPDASTNNPLSVVVGRTTFQPTGATLNTAAFTSTPIVISVISINKSSKTLGLASALPATQLTRLSVELAHQMPVCCAPVSGHRPLSVKVTDRTKLPGSTTTSTFAIAGSGVPDRWILTNNSGSAITPHGPVPYTYFPTDVDMPVRVAANTMLSIPLANEVVKYKGYNLLFGLWGSTYDLANSTSPTDVSELSISFDGGATYTSYTPTVTGESCNALFSPKQYTAIARIPTDATSVWMRIKFTSTGDSDFVIHRVRAFVPGVHRGTFLGDGTVPRNETKIKSGHLLYTWSPDQLTTAESTSLGLNSVTQESPGHIDTISPASIWLDKFNVSEYVGLNPANLVGAFSDADFTSGAYSNMRLVLRTPSRFTHLQPLTVSDQEETISWSASSQYVLSFECDQSTSTTVIFQDDVPLTSSDWSFVNSTTVQLATTPNPLSTYKIKYVTLQRFTTGVLDLGSNFANYLWFADYHIYTRPEIVPLKVSVSYGVQFDSSNQAVLVEPSDQDQTSATLVADTGVTKTIVPASYWTFTNPSTISITPSVFNAGALYTLTYTALTNHPRSQAAVVAEYRSSPASNGISSATWCPFDPNDVVGSTNRYYQLRLTVNNVRDVRDYRLQSACLKGLNMFGAGGTVPVLRPGTSDDLTVSDPVTVDYVVIDPSGPTLDVSDTQQFTLTAFYTNGSSADVTSLASWSTSDTSVITVDSSGLATAAGAGSAQVTGTYSGHSNSADCEVSSAGGIYTWLRNPSNTLVHARTGHAVAQVPADGVNQGFIWVISGQTASTATDNTVEVSTIAPTGGLLSGFSLTASVPNLAFGHGVHDFWAGVDPVNHFVYILGGNWGDGSNKSYYADYNPTTGALTGWNLTSEWAVTRINYGAVIHSGHAYVAGGYAVAPVNAYTTDVAYATVNSPGLGTWNNTTSLPQPLAYMAMIGYNGYMYVYGMETSGFTTHIYAAAINGDGSLGAWSHYVPTGPAFLFSPSLAVHTGNKFTVLDLDGGNVYVADIDMTTGALSNWATDTSIAPTWSDSANGNAGSKAAQVTNGQIFITGGEDIMTGDPINDVVFDLP